jgi:hypothetical protein
MRSADRLPREDLAQREAAGAVLRASTARHAGFSRSSEFYLGQLRVVRRRIAASHLSVDDLRAARPLRVLQAAALTDADFLEIMADLAAVE